MYLPVFHPNAHGFPTASPQFLPKISSVRSVHVPTLVPKPDTHYRSSAMLVCPDKYALLQSPDTPLQKQAQYPPSVLLYSHVLTARSVTFLLWLHDLSSHRQSAVRSAPSLYGLPVEFLVPENVRDTLCLVFRCPMGLQRVPEPPSPLYPVLSLFFLP